MSSRWVNVVMGLVLFCTGVAARGGVERANGLALGLSVFLVAFLAMAVRVRRVNTLLGAWAALSPFVLAYRDPVPGWIDVATGVVVVVASLWPDRPREPRARAARAGAA
jgi:hypothetical protein